MTRAPRLADVCIGRDNGVQAIRLTAAIAVIVFHCRGLTGRLADEPRYRLIPQTNLVQELRP